MASPEGGQTVEADLCLIGAGPAGLTIARELIDSGLQIVVLESGEFAHDEEAQALSAGEQQSSHHASGALRNGRNRQFGGTSNLWLSRTVPASGRRHARAVVPESIDLEPRFGNPAVGWPITIDDLGPYIGRVLAFWNGAPYDYSVERWAAGAEPITDGGGRLTTAISLHGPNDVFGLRFRDDLMRADNVRLLMGSTVLRLQSARGDDRIEQVDVAGRDGTTFTVQARAIVLAAGGIENAQLLLLSPSGAPGGASNQHDNVGRYFTDHPEFRMGSITPPDPAVLDRLALYDLRWIDRCLAAGFLTLTEAVKRDEGLLNMSVALALHGRGFGTDAHWALTSAAPIRNLRPSDVISIARSLVMRPGDAVQAVLEKRRRQYEEWAGGWSRPEVDRRELPVIELHAAPEQTARRENRVLLGTARDRFGRRRPRVEWCWDAEDHANITRSITIVAEELRSIGLGNVRRWAPFTGRHAPRFGGFHHPMGATRMHPDPAEGVVDVDCRVHGLENLFVAGSSVFPSGHGYANPTLSVLALAVRLADHLRDWLGGAAEQD